MSSSVAELTTQGWINLKQFASIAGVTQQTAASWANKGYIKAIRVGRERRVYIDEVKRFLNEGNRDEQ